MNHIEEYINSILSESDVIQQYKVRFNDGYAYVTVITEYGKFVELNAFISKKGFILQSSGYKDTHSEYTFYRRLIDIQKEIRFKAFNELINNI